MLTKSAQIGHAHKLPDNSKEVTETQIASWSTCFVGNLTEEEATKMEAFKFLWRRDDHKKVATIPARGIPKNVNDLIYLMADGRICRESVDIPLDQWTTMLSTTAWQPVR